MSILPMFKGCPHCKRSFSYNPSTGNFSIFCKHCGKLVGSALLSVQEPDLTEEVDKRRDSTKEASRK